MNIETEEGKGAEDDNVPVLKFGLEEEKKDGIFDIEQDPNDPLFKEKENANKEEPKSDNEIADDERLKSEI